MNERGGIWGWLIKDKEENVGSWEKYHGFREKDK